VRISSRPVYVLRELVDLLRRERVVLPGYTYLQDLVREALAFERKRLAGALEGLMSLDAAKSIDRLLTDDEGLHQITTIKRQPRDFTYRQLLREIERGQQLQALFALAERVIAQVDLSAESVRYYASLVEFYTVYKLKRMYREAVRLYLLCFVHDRYQRLNDNLLGAFCSLVRRYVEEVDAATKEAIYRFKLQTSEDIEQGAKVLALFVDPGIDGETRFAEVREQAHALLPAGRLQQLCRHLAGEGVIDEGAFEWREVDGIKCRGQTQPQAIAAVSLFAGNRGQRQAAGNPGRHGRGLRTRRAVAGADGVHSFDPGAVEALPAGTLGRDHP
jgi:hypothetical protein